MAIRLALAMHLICVSFRSAYSRDFLQASPSVGKASSDRTADTLNELYSNGTLGHPHAHPRRRRHPQPRPRPRPHPTWPAYVPMPGDEEVVREANELFNLDEDGILFHTKSDSTYDIDNVPHGNQHYNGMSWVVLNKIAVDSKNVITLYKEGLRPAIMAKKSAFDIVACMYPCDGTADERRYQCPVSGCPCEANKITHTGARSDWCGNNEVHGQWKFSCAMKPNETAHMLKAYKDVRAGNSSLLQARGRDREGRPYSACGYWIQNNEEHNEIVMDATKWNQNIKQHLWAFVMTDSCHANPYKKQEQLGLYYRYKQKYGDIPMVYLDRYNTEKPFSVYAGK